VTHTDQTPDPIDKLERIVADVERHLLDQARKPANPLPELARDTTGRYLLLDAYAALATARAARDQLAAALIAHPLSHEQADRLRRRGLIR
jgi:hypothetical protein